MCGVKTESPGRPLGCKTIFHPWLFVMVDGNDDEIPLFEWHPFRGDGNVHKITRRKFKMRIQRAKNYF